MPGQFVNVMVAQVVREAHHPAERASELGVRRIQYPAVHHPAGKRKRRLEAGDANLKSMQRVWPASGGHDVEGRDELYFIHMNLPIISPGCGNMRPNERR